MARQRDSKLVGTFGNLIFYEHQGDYRIRSRPASVKRTAASIRSGLNFGKASKMSLQIRKLVTLVNPSKSEGSLSFRLTGALNKFIDWKEKQDQAAIPYRNGLPFLQGFQFNTQSDLSSITAIQASINLIEPGSMEIKFAPFIPSEVLHAPFNTDHIIFKMILTGTDIEAAETENLWMTELLIPLISSQYQPPALSFPVSIKWKRLVMMSMSIQYIVNGKDGGVEMLTNPRKMPCGVAWAGWI